ncbi:MAG TPA: hypothetical protein VGS97_08370 [Actinocrinis sp.]|uniref:hypothetical protein n=1 Tax=Actinocrinis sp. TaxID=1920516 RepID=UPI002DDD94F0|nr:hypothetical protein [Actinocrinis sp.]HEV2344092.1 hypothetical protein [Actinocrinis sp.]
MTGSEPMHDGTGLSASDEGFTFTPTATTLGAESATSLRFKITDRAGTAVTSFVPDQTKLMHLYLVRSDLAEFQHVHPTMAADGIWTSDLAALTPGNYRAYVTFDAKNALGGTVSEVLSKALTVHGTATATALPATSSTITADGYTLTVSGKMTAAMPDTLTVTISENGQPVSDLQPYLGAYAHLTAIHAGDLAFAHLHPEGPTAMAMSDAGGPTLTFHALMPESGDWRVFIQFQTGGVLHTAAITLRVA